MKDKERKKLFIRTCIAAWEHGTKQKCPQLLKRFFTTAFESGASYREIWPLTTPISARKENEG